MPKLIYNEAASHYLITVPMTLVKFKGWKPGDVFEFVEDGRDILFVKVEG